MYDGEDEFKYLCANCSIDPPEEPWRYVENNTVRRICEWLYGVPGCKSVGIISDFDLMRLVFASVGTADFEFLKVDFGYKRGFSYGDPNTAHLVEAGILPEHADDWPTIPWLEHEVRLITSNLRPIDKYYEPYDQLAEKAG